MGGKRYTAEMVQEIIDAVHSNLIQLDKNTFKNTGTKAKFIDRDFGEWWARPRHIINGVGNPQRAIEKNRQLKRLSPEEVQKRVTEIHEGKVQIDLSTYIDMNTKCRFIDIDYGEWWAVPNHVTISKTGHKNRWLEKAKKTYQEKYGCKHSCLNPEVKKKTVKSLIERYGVDNSQKNKEIALKNTRKTKHRYILSHWKTNEEIVCVGSYERKVVERLNQDKIDFLWQPTVFTMEDSKTYRPDLFIISKDKWIEIKGYGWPESIRKWNWFHENYPNSELWDKQKLKELKIL